MTSGTACLLTQSWINQHLPSMIEGVFAHVWPEERDELFMEKHKYKECLAHLAMSFSGLIGRLDAALRSNPTLCRYPPMLLRHRNAELLALVLVNLAAMNLQPHGFHQLSVAVRQVSSQYHSSVFSHSLTPVAALRIPLHPSRPSKVP